MSEGRKEADGGCDRSGVGRIQASLQSVEFLCRGSVSSSALAFDWKTLSMPSTGIAADPSLEVDIGQNLILLILLNRVFRQLLCDSEDLLLVQLMHAHFRI